MTGRLRPSDEVRGALDRDDPLVALETSVISHGLPHPWNFRAAQEMEQAVRQEGATPAWTWVGGGSLHLGATRGELASLAGGGAKVARRDLPAVLAGLGLGGTTVSATLWSAHAAGIEVVVTGGIGGVHPGSGDVSADLAELARTPGTLVCSGPKSIVNPGATLERLEELGVGVIGYGCDRLPFFLVRETEFPVEHRADDPEAVAAISRARAELGLRSSVLVCNPVPAAAALPADIVAGAVSLCTERAGGQGIVGKDLTPFLLSCLAEQTGGASLEANLALLVGNARLAARIAAAMA
jgi:pseudouridine-5'-phosphate glycosidase